VGFDIGICASIFFVVALSHIGLRNNIVSDEIFYLEYFCMVMYLNLIWVCCHSILSGFNLPALEKWTIGVSAKKAYFPTWISVDSAIRLDYAAKRIVYFIRCFIVQ
jgi:hypothetical protein